MRSDGRFGMTSFEVSVKASKPIKLIPVGDIHYGAENHAEEAFDEFCRYAKTQDAYYILMGDYMELFSATEQRTLLKAYKDDLLRENARLAIESDLKRQLSKLAAKIEFMRGRTLGVLCGNHSYTFEDGISTDMLLAQRLEAPYLGVLGCIRLVLSRSTTSKSTIWIWAHHGKPSSGKTVGHHFNTLDDMARFLHGDIYLMGDDHSVGVVPCKDEIVPVVDTRTGVLSVKQRKRYLARTGSFLKGYVPGKKSYIADRLLRPNAIGFIELSIRCYEKTVNGVKDQRVEIKGTC